jgi:HlyD family secretion protein
MLRKILLPILAIIGVIFSVFMIYYGTLQPPIPSIPYPPPKSPYQHYIAGEGIVEAIDKNVPIGISFDELVTDIYVKVGDIVKKGDSLFKLDTRKLEAQLDQAIKNQKLAQTEYENSKIQFSFYQRLKNKSAVSEQDFTSALYAMKIAHDKLEVAIATVNLIKTDLERSISRAPTDGEVLQINICVGQSVDRAGQLTTPLPGNQAQLFLFGDTQFYHLRVNIDEEDAWRTILGAPATAFVRGNAKIFIPLEFVYHEPYIVPKVSLNGSDIERVDTRVLQLIYKFPKNKYPVFAGQLLDVYVEAKPDEAQK